MLILAPQKFVSNFWGAVHKFAITTQSDLICVQSNIKANCPNCQAIIFLHAKFNV